MQNTSLLLFLLTSMLIILAPGQDMILVLSRAMTEGTKAGVTTAAGVGSGLLGHTLLVAAGLGAALQTSELLFSLMKYLGALYLLYLGVRAFRAPVVDITANVQLDCDPGSMKKIRLRTFFIQGALSNLSNPKIALFYFAYLPQFVTAGSASPTGTLLALGATFAALTIIVKIPVALLAGALSGWIQNQPLVQIWLNRSCGGVLIAMGLQLALSETTGD